ncbi:transcriptional regulator, partial [Streptomyces sp. SID3343]|nr:transcriptional regulator [Streptomyces sp. SID3343]
RVAPGLVRMMAGWDRQPALVLGRCLDILAGNALGDALFGTAADRNLVRLVFLDPAGRDFYPEWDRVAANTVAGLRSAAGADPNDPRLTALVGELSMKSREFSRLWARHDLRRKTGEAKRFNHPLVGNLTLTYESLTINSDPGQQLVVYEAEPNSPSAHALTLLGSLTAPARPTTPPTHRRADR